MIKIYPQNIKSQNISFYADNTSKPNKSSQTECKNKVVTKQPVNSKDTFYKRHKKGIIFTSSAISVLSILAASPILFKRIILNDKFENSARKILKKKTPEKFEKALEKSLANCSSDNEKFKIFEALTNFHSSKFYSKSDEFYKKLFEKLYKMDSSNEDNICKIARIINNLILNLSFESNISDNILHSIIDTQKKAPDDLLKVNAFNSLQCNCRSSMNAEHIIKIYNMLTDIKGNTYKNYSNYSEDVINMKTLKQDLLERHFWNKNPEESMESAKTILGCKDIKDTDKLSVISSIALNNNISYVYEKKNNQQIEIAKMLMKYIFENKADSFESRFSILEKTKFSAGNNIFGFLLKNKALPKTESLNCIKKLQNIGMESNVQDFNFYFYMSKLNLEEIKIKSAIFEEKHNNKASTKDFEDYADDMLKTFERALNFKGSSFYDYKYEFEKFQNSATKNKTFNNKTSNIYDRINQFYKDNFEINDNKYKNNWNSESYYNNNYDFNINTNKSAIDKAKEGLLKYLKQNPEMVEIAQDFEQSEATEKNIKKIQRILIMKYHPDKAPNDKKDTYTKITQEINQNIEILKKLCGK